MPPPNNYNKEGMFDFNAKKAKGYSFSHDHKKSLITSFQATLVPGPGKYAYSPDKHDFQRISYSLRGKYENPLETKRSVACLLLRRLAQGSTKAFQT